MKAVLRLLGRPVPGRTERRPAGPSRTSRPPPAGRVTPVDAGLVSVALPVPFQAPFTYRMPAGVPAPERGVRVLVPFGGRRMIGVVDRPGGRETAGQALKEVAAGPRREPARRRRRSSTSPRGWPSTTWRRPGECYRLVLPPAGVRASRAVVRLVKPARRRAPEDPVLRQLAGGPLRLSALAKRLGRDPQARVARLRRAGVVEVEQDLDAPGLPRAAGGRARRRAVRAAGPRAGRGARAAARGRRARPRGRPRARPALAARARSTGSPRRARCASSTSATCARPAGLPARDAPAVVPTAGPGGGAAAARSTPSAAAAFRPVPAPRRHGQRQDGGLLPRRRGGARARPRRDRARARDRPHADARARRAGALRGARCRCCTASSRRASGTTSGGASARARRASSSARARRCSRRCPTSGSSSSTRSTTGPTSRTRARATTGATSR